MTLGVARSACSWARPPCTSTSTPTDVRHRHRPPAPTPSHDIILYEPHCATLAFLVVDTLPVALLRYLLECAVGRLDASPHGASGQYCAQILLPPPTHTQTHAPAPPPCARTCSKGCSVSSRWQWERWRHAPARGTGRLPVPERAQHAVRRKEEGEPHTSARRT